MTMSSQEFSKKKIPLILLLAHLALFAITPNQPAKPETKQLVLSSAAARDVDTSGYKISDSDVTDFFCENPQLKVDAVFRSVIDNLFSLQCLKIWKCEDQYKVPL